MIFTDVISNEDIKITSFFADINEYLRNRRRSFTDPHLHKITQIKNLSAKYQLPEIEITTYDKELYGESKQTSVLPKISEMIDKIVDEDREGLFTKIDKNKLLDNISKTLKNISVEWEDIPDDELFKRISKIAAVESVAGMLKEAEPEEIKVFDEAVKRRPFFK